MNHKELTKFINMCNATLASNNNELRLLPVHIRGILADIFALKTEADEIKRKYINLLEETNKTKTIQVEMEKKGFKDV